MIDEKDREAYDRAMRNLALLNSLSMADTIAVFAKIGMYKSKRKK